MSAAVIVLRRPGELLLCHATLRHYWDLPKGECEPGEAPRAAAVRELFEETSLVAHPEQLIDLDRHRYRPSKDLHVFLLEPGAVPIDLAGLRCTSTFFAPRQTLHLPEVDAYPWTQREDLGRLCTAHLQRLLAALAW